MGPEERYSSQPRCGETLTKDKSRIIVVFQRSQSILKRRKRITVGQKIAVGVRHTFDSFVGFAPMGLVAQLWAVSHGLRRGLQTFCRSAAHAPLEPPRTFSVNGAASNISCIIINRLAAQFGDSLRSKTKTAQVNESLCKVLCHNICCIIQSNYELDIKPEFWAEAA
jgi:hypothetical protein